MIELDNRVDFDIDIKFLEKIAKKITDKEIELILTNSEEIKELNKRYRDIDKPTDVLSFPYEEIPHSPLGSIVINFDFAKDVSCKLNHKVEDEIALLFIHALLHLVGFDHESDSGEMREAENKLIKEFELPDSLIIRNIGHP